MRLCLRRMRLRLRRGRAMNLPWTRHRRQTRIPKLTAYRLERPGGRASIHLRQAQDGSGELFVNANQVYRLNPTAGHMAALALAGASDEVAARSLSRSFRADRQRLADDYTSFREQLEALVVPGSACPIHDLDLDLTAPFSETPPAPYRMDLALTYRCNDDCPHCYNARPRSFPELPTESWRQILERLWGLGIPHICFTGGEATLRPDLPDLVAYAHNLGHVVGLLSNGRRLSVRGTARELADAGLDHVQITLESSRPEVHDRMVGAAGAWRQTVEGIRRSLDAGMFVMTNTTLLADNADHVLETIDFLAGIGVPTIGCNALIFAGRGAAVGSGLPEASLGPLLQQVRARTDEHGQRLIWYTPTQYCHFDPVEAELGVKGCSAARTNLCIEPDGSVLPCQSFYQPLGNLLTDPWDSIWNHDLAIWLRERRYLADACLGCTLVAECGGGCPLSPPGGKASAARAWVPAASVGIASGG